MAQNVLLETVFSRRGYTAEYLKSINVSTDATLLNMDALCAHLFEMQGQPHHIVFIPDFDMDGIMSGVIGFAGLAELGFRVSLYIPDPSDGYGFNAHTIQKIVTLYPDVTAIMTGDNGITCHQGIWSAKICGLTVLITDHHKSDVPAGEDYESEADCVVDPMLPQDTYPHKYICGAAVVYKCLQHYADTYCTRMMQEQIRRLRVFAGIGTVSDSMPMLYENRQLVRDAISICRLVYSNGSDFVVRNMYGCDIYRRAFYGLHTVFRMMADFGRVSKPGDIDESFFGFYLAPMFNSVKRIGDDMTRAFGVFFGADATDCVSYLYTLNNRRKELTETYLDDILNSDQPFAPYLYLCDAPTGILGLLATRFMAETGVPTIVARKDETLHGSGRSPEWYALMSRLDVKGVHIAGHDVAFGISFDSDDEASLQAFVTALRDDSERVKSTMDLTILERRPDLVIAHDGSGDTIIDIVLFLEYLDELQMFRPFGNLFAEPDILLKFRASDGEWSTLGSMKQHLRIRLAHGFEVLLWNQADQIDRKDSDEVLEVWGRLSRNEYNGIQTVQFIGSF